MWYGSAAWHSMRHREILVRKDRMSGTIFAREPLKRAKSQAYLPGSHSHGEGARP